MIKKCSVCKIEKPITEFHKDLRKKFGVGYLCKVCCKIKQDKYWRTDKGRYATAKRVAKAKKLTFNLSFEVHKKKTSEPCTYCGEYIKSDSTSYFLDRIDSTKGYEENNICPCCHDCNFLKSNWNYDEFIELCIKIANNHKRIKYNGESL